MGSRSPATCSEARTSSTFARSVTGRTTTVTFPLLTFSFARSFLVAIITALKSYSSRTWAYCVSHPSRRTQRCPDRSSDILLLPIALRANERMVNDCQLLIFFDELGYPCWRALFEYCPQGD